MTIPFTETEEMRDQIDVLELEVRRIPGVISVSITEKDDSNTLSVVAPLAIDEDEIRRIVSQLVRTYTDSPFTIQIDTNALKAEEDQSGESDTIEVVEASSVEESTRPELAELTTVDDSIVVKLEWQGKTGEGKSSARTLNHAAEATLLALDDLGAPVPFYVRSVTPLGAALRDAVVVVLRSSEAAEERFGVATGESAREATARATLDALNRFLAFRYSQQQ